MASEFRSRHLPLLLLVFIATSLTLSHGQEEIDRARLDRLVREVMRCGRIPALALAIVNQQQERRYVNTYGTIESGIRANTDTRFCLGEATEAFTAVLLAKLLHGHENVTWTTPIQDITGKRLAMPDEYRASHLNLMDIFAQRSGLPGMDIVPIVGPYTTTGLLRGLQYVKEVTGFRQKYIPNQILFALLEDVFQVLGKDSWENLLQRYILTPLDMKSVNFLGQEGNVANQAYPMVSFNGKSHALSLESFKGLNLIKSAATVCLSVEDMYKWMRFLMHGKDKNNQQLIHMKDLERTFKGIQPRSNGESDPELSGYRDLDFHGSYSRDLNALGWITGHHRGYQFVSQDGSLPGYQALATIVPSRNTAVYVAFNGDGGRKGFAVKVLLNMVALDVALGGNSWYNNTNMCDHLDRMRDKHPVDEDRMYPDIVRMARYTGKRPLTDYVGYYRNYAYGDLRVKFNETEDSDLQMEYGYLQYKMLPTKTNNTFQLIARGLYSFTTNADIFRRNRLIAVFSDDDPEAERHFTTLTVSNFDRNGNVVFSTNPNPPVVERTHGGSDDPRCGAAVNSAVSLLSLLLLSVTVLFR